MKYKKYVKLCEMIGITPLSFSNWTSFKEIDEHLYSHLINNMDNKEEKIKTILKSLISELGLYNGNFGIISQGYVEDTYPHLNAEDVRHYDIYINDIVKSIIKI